MSFALYPKLLAEKKSEDIAISLKMVLMFAIPMTACAVAMANSYIVLLRPTLADYPGAELVLVVLTLDALLTVISGIYGSVVYGVETVDESGKISLRELVKSKMFILFSLPYVHSAITLPVTYYTLTAYALNQPLQAALSVSIINSAVRFAMFVVLYIIVRRMIKIHIPWRSISKYIFASAVMSAILFLAPYLGIISTGIISTTLALTAVGGITYLVVLMVIDKEARALPKAILKEVKKNDKSGSIDNSEKTAENHKE